MTPLQQDRVPELARRGRSPPRCRIIVRVAIGRPPTSAVKVWCYQRGIDTWSLTSLQQRLVKTGGAACQARPLLLLLLLAGSHLTRRLFGSTLRRIWALPVPTG